MKRVCFLVGSMSNSGGTERVTSLIANELVKSNYQVFILNLEGCSKSFFYLDSHIQIDSLYSKKTSLKWNYFSALWHIRNYVIKNSIESFVVVDSISCVLTIPALLGLRINHICWEHFNFNQNVGLRLRDVGRKWAAKYCDYVVTLTERDKILWENSIKNIKAVIIPIPNPTPYENTGHYPSLKFKTILSLGRLTYQKGFDLLIDAWALVCDLNPDWILRIVGSGEDEQQLKDQAKRLNIFDRIEFIPATQDVQHHYETSSFYCMSSRFEGLPMVLLEAQAFGLPIVAFDCDTGPSDIIENKVSGFLAENGNVKDLATKILLLLNSNSEEYNSMIIESKDNSKKFYISNVINKWKKIL